MDKVRMGVVGDVMLDVSVYGRFERYSPENDEILILRGNNLTYRLGGAGNVAALAAREGFDVTLWGAIGKDDVWGSLIEDVCRREHISYFLSRELSVTTLKFRSFTSETDCVSRTDVEETFLGNNVLSPALMISGDLDIFVVSDYNKGVVSEHTIEPLMKTLHQVDCPVIVNTKPSKIVGMFSGVDALVCNWSEAAGIANVLGLDGKSLASEIRSSLNVTLAVVTNADKHIEASDMDGMWHVEPPRVDKPQVIGAGDAFLVGLAKAWATCGYSRKAVSDALQFASSYVRSPRM